MDKEYLDMLKIRFLRHVKNIGRDMVDEVMKKIIGKSDIKDLTVKEMIRLLDILDTVTGEDEPMSAGQRRMFFWYANQIGEENAREVMKRITGKTSLRECTKKDMIRILDELIRVTKIYPEKKLKRKKKRRSKKSSAVKRGDKYVELPSKKMQKFLDDLVKKVYGDNIEKYEKLCERMIGVKRPITKGEVWIMIQGLKKIKEKWENKEKEKRWIN